jgi:TRAP-type C4-dicarboxylate transport system substrate-binding protein
MRFSVAAMFARTITPLALAAVAIGACGGTQHNSRTGGKAPVKATTLVLSTALGGLNDRSALEAYAADVARRSGGTLKIDVRTRQLVGDPAQERKLVGAVRDGKSALGVVGARVLDTEGVHSFQALLAPGLVTSVKQEEDVISGDIGDEMLAGLKPAGVAGLGLFPGPLRRLAGFTRDYRKPADLKGARVGVQESEETRATLRALGATPVALPAGADIAGVDAYEQQLESIAGNDYTRALSSITADALWPRPLVVIANPDAVAKLSDRQRQALTDAIPAGRAAFADGTVSAENDSLAQLCRAGTKFVSFAPGALAAATKPVYDEIARDPATKRFLAQIRAMDAQPDPAPKCSAAQTAHARQASAFDGVYRMYQSKKLQARIDNGTPTPENWGRWVLVIDRGRMVWTQNNPDACTWSYGTVELKGDRMTWNFQDGGGIAPTNANNKPGEQFVWQPKLYRDTLSLHAIEPAGLKPSTVRWSKVSDQPTKDVFYERCEPPAAAQVG